jgi:hypothetical protein
MLLSSTAILVIAALLGISLAVLHARGERPKRPSWKLAALHGILGLSGLMALLIALQGPPRGVQTGEGQFGLFAAVLLTVTLVVGIVPIVARVRRRPLPALTIGLHATLAIMGLVILAAYVSAS